NVRLKASEHLPRSLPADAAVDEIPVGKVFVQPPPVRNRIAQEDDAGFVRFGRSEPSVRFSVAGETVGVGIAKLLVLSRHQRAEMRFGACQYIAYFRELLLLRLREGKGLGHGVGKLDEGPEIRKESVVLFTA